MILKRFIFETLSIGLDERAKKKEETIALIEKEEKTLPEVEKDSLERAEFAFNQNNNIESLVMTTIALETNLQKALKLKKINAEGKPFSEIIQLAAKEQILNLNDVNNLREISHFRNRAVHEGEMPSPKTTKWILETSRLILNQLNAYSLSTSDYAIESNPKLPEEVETFIKRRRLNENAKKILRNLIPEIEKMPEITERSIKETTISYKAAKPFVSLEPRKSRIILHLTLPKEPKIKGVDYLRSVYGNLMHGHLIVDQLDQVTFAINVCKKAHDACLKFIQT